MNKEYKELMKIKEFMCAFEKDFNNTNVIDEDDMRGWLKDNLSNYFYNENDENKNQEEIVTVVATGTEERVPIFNVVLKNINNDDSEYRKQCRNIKLTIHSSYEECPLTKIDSAISAFTRELNKEDK